MNYIYIYAAIAIAYQIFKFVRARQKAAEEEVQKQAQKNVNKPQPAYSYETVDPIFKSIEDTRSSAFSAKEISVNYDDRIETNLVEDVEIKAYQIPKNKRATLESRSFESQNKTKTNVLTNFLNSKSELRKSIIAAEILKTKF